MGNTTGGRNARNKGRYWAAFLILALLVLVFVVLSICIGTVNIPLAEIPKDSGKKWEATTPIRISSWESVFRGRRQQASWAAAWLCPAIFCRPSSITPSRVPLHWGSPPAQSWWWPWSWWQPWEMRLRLSSWVLIIAAFAGAMLCMGFVILMSRVMDQMSMLIVSGVMIGYICSAVTDFVVTFADDADIVNLHNWSKGSFSGMTWDNVLIMAIVVGITAICVFLMSKPISAYQMGEAYAKNMGLNVQVFRVLLVLLSSVLSACVTAFAGPVSFVGIAVPHLVKNLFGTAKPILMIPACFLGGAAFCLFCDLLARTMFAPTELSISTVTAVFGAPVVIYIMIHRKKERAE